mgnify:CR=1 FL=1
MTIISVKATAYSLMPVCLLWRRLRKNRVLNDKPDYFYIVKNVELSATAQDSDVSVDFTVTLTCEPGAYLVVGKREHEVPEVLQNLYNVAHPVYKITGEGNCTLTINRHIVIANVA